MDTHTSAASTHALVDAIDRRFVQPTPRDRFAVQRIPRDCFVREQPLLEDALSSMEEPRRHQLDLQKNGETVGAAARSDGHDDASAPAVVVEPAERRHMLELQKDGETLSPNRDRQYLLLLATAAGNALEWYDFALFGFLAPELSRLFFPPGDPNSRLLETFMVFGAAFLVRPVGGLVVGAFSDAYGRRAALQLSVASMAGATAAIGLLPTYAAAGSLATCLLVACRVVQGLSVAGQLTGALVFLVESAPAGHENLFGSFAFASGNAGTMLGGVAVSLAKERFDARALADYGWRYPFLLSAVLGVGGYYVQSLVDESPEFLEIQNESREKTAAPDGHADNAAADALRRSGPKVAAVAAVCLLSPAAFYSTYIFAPAYYGMGGDSSVLATRALFLSCLLVPVCGAWLDVRSATHGPGQRWLFLGNAALLLLFASPFVFASFAAENSLLAQLGLLVATLGHSAYNAALAAWLVGAFAPGSRGMILGVVWNVAAAFVGGTSPVLCMELIRVTGSEVAPGCYVSALAAVALVGLHRLRRAEEAGLVQ